MAAIGGSLLWVSFAGRMFAVAADAESNRGLGGWENEVQANGDGSVRVIGTRVPSFSDSLTVSVDDDRADQEYIQGLADSKQLFTIGLGYASGAVYQCSGQFTGEIRYSSKNATCSVTVSGTNLTKQ